MTDTPDPLRGPVLIEVEGAEADPGLAPAVPDPAAAAVPPAMAGVARLARARGSRAVRFALWAFGALFGFVLSVAAWDFVTGLFGRSGPVGWIAVGLLGLAVLSVLILAVQEWAAYARLSRIDHLRDRAVAAATAGDLAAAKGVVAAITALYAARPDTAWGRARLAERTADVFDADALLALLETEVVAPLDQTARREIETAARQVALVTALVPLALADVAMALYANLRMIRRIAELYGGRSGSFGSLRLMRRVFGHLVATGAVALTDDLIHSVAGGGVLSKVSRRFGEGVVNGALTARVGVATMEVCRPLPFVAAPKPKVTNLVSRGLAGLLDRTGGREG